MRISRKQYDFLLNSNARINIMDGAVRSGKTFIMNIRWLDYVKNGPPGNLLMTGKTIRTLEQNVLEAPAGIFDILGANGYSYNRSNGELSIGGRKIYCKGANDEKSEAKIRGLTLSGAYCDEITLYPKSFVDQMIARCSVQGSQLFWNCNPDSPFHFIKTDYIDDVKMKDLVEHWTFFMQDNPYLIDNNPEYIKQAEKIFKGVFYRRNVLGQWAIADGLVYPQFSKEHIISNIPQSIDRYYVGVDYGTVHPTVFLLLGIHQKDIYVLKEFHAKGKTDSQLAADFAQFIKGYKIHGITVDSAASSFILELRNHGYYITESKKDVIPGISEVSSKLGENHLFVNSSCQHTIHEFYSYSWDVKKSQSTGKDCVIKLGDDCMDALRYCIMTFLVSNRLKSFKKSLLGF